MSTVMSMEMSNAILYKMVGAKLKFDKLRRKFIRTLLKPFENTNGNIGEGIGDLKHIIIGVIGVIVAVAIVIFISKKAKAGTSWFGKQADDAMNFDFKIE